MGGQVAGLEPGRIADGESDLLVLRHLDVLKRLFVIPGGRGQLQHVELLSDRRFEVLVAEMDVGGDQKTVELILDDHLPVVGVGLARKLGGGLLHLLLVLIRDGFDEELPGLSSRLQKKASGPAQAEDARC